MTREPSTSPPTSFEQAEAATAPLPALKAEAERAVSSLIYGDHGQNRSGLGEKFWQFREYHNADRPQDIDWRQSAKTDAVYTRQKENQTSQNVYFWCAQHAGMRYRSQRSLPSKQERAHVITLALAMLMIKAGEQIGLFGSNRTGRSKAALNYIENLLESQNDAHATLPSPSIFKLPQHAFLFQAGDFLDETDTIVDTFEHLAARSQNGFILQILDPAELELPFEGRILFEDTAHRNKSLIHNVSSIRDAYKARIEAHNQTLSALCQDQGWGFHTHRTDDSLHDVLSVLWERLSHPIKSGLFDTHTGGV